MIDIQAKAHIISDKAQFTLVVSTELFLEKLLSEEVLQFSGFIVVSW